MCNENFGADDECVRRWLDEEHQLDVSRATFSRFKKKYHPTGNGPNQKGYIDKQSHHTKPTGLIKK